MKLRTGALAVITLFAAGYAAKNWLQNYLSANATGKAPSCLDIAGSTTNEDEGATYIIGSVRNDCDRSFSQVTVLFKLDAQPGAFGDLPEGNAYAYVRDLKPGQVRDFKTAQPVGKNASYRFDGINAF